MIDRIQSFCVSGVSRKTQNLILGSLFAVFVLSFYSCSTVPLQNQVQELGTLVDALRAELQEDRLAAESLPVLRAEMRSQEERLKQLLESLAKEQETDDVLEAVQQLARECNLRIKSFVPQGPSRTEFYENWPIQLSVEGTYHNLRRFFEGVAQFNRIINIDDINIQALGKPSQRSRTLRATCTATTFVYRADSPHSRRRPDTREVASIF